jgi:hypothetical protein
VSRRLLAFDAAIAAALAALVLIISPGAAVDGIVAVIVLVGCGLSLVVARLARARVWRRRRRSSPFA